VQRESVRVLIHSENLYGEAVSIGLFMSKVKYFKDGKIQYEDIENEDLTFIEEE
jgi:hypothetical protein